MIAMLRTLLLCGLLAWGSVTPVRANAARPAHPAVPTEIRHSDATVSLVSQLYRQLQAQQLTAAYPLYEALCREVPTYMGYYETPFALYVSVCVQQLRLQVGPDEAHRFYQLCLQAPDLTPAAHAHVLAQLAQTLDQYQQPQLALTYYEKLLTLEPQLPALHFHRYLLQAAWVYNQCQLPQKSFLAFRRCARYYREHFGPLSQHYARALNGLTTVARYLNVDYLPWLQAEQSLYRQRGDTLSASYAVCLDHLSHYYLRHGDADRALTYARQACRLFEQQPSQTADLAIVHNNLGAIYEQLGRHQPDAYAQAEEHLMQSLLLDPRPVTAYNLGKLYDTMGQPENARTCYDLLDESDRHTEFAIGLAQHYAQAGDYERFATYMRHYLQYLRTISQENILWMTAAERSRYVQLVQTEQMDALFQWAAADKHPSLAGLCYDYLLMSKSLLLSYDHQIDKIVQQSDSESLRHAYFTLSVLRSEAQRQPALQARADSLEHAFLDRLSREARFSDFTRLRHTDLQQHLEPSDAAIEFYAPAGSDTTHLYAVILQASHRPVVVRCATSGVDASSGHTLAHRLWQQLAPRLSTCRRLFFVPHGHLYNHPFESELSLVAPEVAVYRLSSSRQLLTEARPTGQGIVIYGGLDYDMDIRQMQADEHRYAGRFVRSVTDGVDSTFLTRAALAELDPLPGTLTEAQTIGRLLTESRQTVHTYLGSRGTEASFKALSGQSPRVLHLATHGFYQPDRLLVEAPSEADLLCYSGLFLAGANHQYAGDPLPGDLEDGILSAREIAHLDFRGVELVGLSACQTALGTVTTDGVFGLQRGFKQAGARTLLMSLWQVDDAATSYLMTEFYTAWITRRMTLHAALEHAKRAVRSRTDRGWDHPHYWAAFILLDAWEGR